MKHVRIFGFALIALMLFAGISFAQEENTVNVHMFYGKGCAHCGRMQAFLEDMQEKYPLLNVNEYETYFDQENRELFQKMADSFETEIEGVPTLFIDDKVIVGFSTSMGESIENEIKACIEQDCGDPINKVRTEETIEVIGESSPIEYPEDRELRKSLTIPAVISAAAVDAINPCAFAVLIILLTTILASGSKRRTLLAGIAFTTSIYISYFFIGLQLYTVILATGLTRIFYSIVAALAILIGLFNLKDYFWYGKWFVMEVPKSWRPNMKLLIRGVTSVPGAFLVGFIVSLFLLPCTSGPYFAILGLLAQTATRDSAILLLLLYNFIFVLPMLLITFAVYFGFTTTEQAEAWRTKKLKVLHLIAGIIILLLGVGMFIAMWLGML